jgi:hypothetical protein
VMGMYERMLPQLADALFDATCAINCGGAF